MSGSDLYLAWLRDAYAMEKQVEEVLARHADQASDYPEIRAKILEHLSLTRSQAERVRSCLERNGSDISTIKTGMANVMGMAMGVSTAPAKDRLIKNALSEYATEHLEIASYTALAEAALKYNDEQTAKICEDIIAEEQAMADWLINNIPMVTTLTSDQ